jgi:2-oxoglutarate dehydrogenase E2 component (dihydrolipoamide succinyltransferase)
MAIDVKVPDIGESVKQAVLLRWHKKDGDTVQVDEPICELETDKANVDIPAPAAGQFKRLKNEGDQVNVGEAIAQIEPSTVAAAKTPAPAKKQQVEVTVPAAAAAAPVAATAGSPISRIVREVIENRPAKKDGNGAPAPSAPAISTTPEKRKEVAPSASVAGMNFDASGTFRQPVSKIRKRIAQTLVDAQHTAAILTTFNEVDVTSIVEIRARYKERFQELYGVGLGYMSFFARGVALALRDYPNVNAFLSGDEIVYHNYVHLGIAVSTERGLAVPVLRDVQTMSFAKIESEIKRLAAAVRDGKLALHELTGGTFTITNGGIYGSLLSTPILTPPQSGILGMHAVQKRPVVIHGKIEIRSMMYIALSYDHRLVDGRESVSFLVRLKQYLEDPARLMLEI